MFCRDVVKIGVTSSYSDKAEIGNVTQMVHKGETVYKADLSFMHSMNGEISMCFQATDVLG